MYSYITRCNNTQLFSYYGEQHKHARAAAHYVERGNVVSSKFIKIMMSYMCIPSVLNSI